MEKSRILTTALSRRRIIKAAGALAAGVAAPTVLRVRSAYAAFPDRPVKIVVANSPGGPSDLVGRILAAALQESTGKTFIVENRGGAGGNIGMGYAAQSEPDGYTILLATDAYSVNPSLYRALPYDPLKSFVAVGTIAISPLTLTVKADTPVKTVKEFVALARAHPDKYNVATPPLGTTSWLLAQTLKLRENLPKLECIVYKGGGDALAALLGGTVQLSSGSLPPAYPHIKAGTLRCLAVTGDSRWPELPNVPTMTEAGYPGIEFANDTALFAPAKTPPEVVKWLEKETVKVLSAKTTTDKLYKAGFKAQPLGAAAAWEHYTKNIAMFKEIIDKAGLKKH